MDIRSFFVLIFKIALLAVLLFFIEGAAATAVGLSAPETADQTKVALSSLFVALLTAAAVSYPIARSYFSGWRLIAVIFLVFFGIRTFLTQIETVLFLRYLVDIVSPEMIPKLFAQGFITAILFSPLAVLVHGKMKKSGYISQEANGQKTMSLNEWIWKLVIIGLIYVVIYIGFGMFVFRPLAGAAFDQYYANLKLPSWVLLFQMVRGTIWACLAIPVVRMMKGDWWEAALAVAVLFAILMGALLLIPTDIMPAKIRTGHFIEVFSSNFLFGWIVVWVLNLKHFPLRNVFKLSRN